ncbi:MAG: ATP-binding cassette domain-containing protein [Clostridiaceae bacterium]|nr:ATP-binding cassette domain-containing protein [Clostridiaceae bacterium]
MKESIKLENVKKIYDRGQGAINDVSLCINEKEQVLIYGTAGSGKSTLMRLIAGLEVPSSGKVFVLDKAVHEMKSDVAADFRNLNFGIIQRNSCFMKSMNLLENVAMPLTVRGVATSKRIHAAKNQLKALGLLYAAHAYPEGISTYEAQLASIARALIGQPKVLLLDEITAGLSEKEGSQILGIIHDIEKLRDLVVISFSGTKDCILRWDRYFTLNHGRIQEEIL